MVSVVESKFVCTFLFPRIAIICLYGGNHTGALCFPMTCGLIVPAISVLTRRNLQWQVAATLLVWELMP
jgi:hypothetical protein